MRLRRTRGRVQFPARSKERPERELTEEYVMTSLKRVGVRRQVCLVLAFLMFFCGGFAGFSAADDEKLTGKTVNVNKATAEELATVPLLTPELAKSIVKYREDNGDFQQIEELLQIKGFTRELLNRVKPFLLLEGLGGDACTC
jgi:competence ComEA-like helix-hairpin-helix protein